MTNKRRAAKKLREAAALITNPANHIRGFLARTADNDVIDYASPAASKFCMTGSVYHVCSRNKHSAVESLAIDALNDAVVDALKNKPYGFDRAESELRNIPYFNDSLATHEEALAAMYAAADKLDGGQVG